MMTSDLNSDLKVSPGSKNNCRKDNNTQPWGMPSKFTWACKRKCGWPMGEPIGSSYDPMPSELWYRHSKTETFVSGLRGVVENVLHSLPFCVALQDGNWLCSLPSSTVPRCEAPFSDKDRPKGNKPGQGGAQRENSWLAHPGPCVQSLAPSKAKPSQTNRKLTKWFYF